ncbi:CidA/LrgA family protein [Methanolobus bombayensis]|uniref:CidA/LrgA family protein n=1 Tax=Methanolobus bombayensis TaxID=38023 RepID=UPI001AE2F2A9|nr:CidA/LrgA family protein [Methanolobus bombayensis]MBP1910032.1 holin-like protein [Methanolobus bombayensis]
MKYIAQFAIILIICYLGELIHNFLHIPIPGNVLGMVLLLILLLTGVVRLSMIEDVSNFMLKHLSFFFIPAGVGLITCFTVLEGKWTALFIISVVSTFIIAVVTGATVQLLIKRRQSVE